MIGRLRLIAMALVFAVVLCNAGAGVGFGLSVRLPSQSESGSHLPDNRRPVVFRNYMDGFEFDVPAGWVISTFYERESGNTIVSVDPPTPGLEDGFRLKRCAGNTPEDCMGDDGMLATLVKVRDIQMAGYPAKEYTYDRQTVQRTRIWKELVSVLHVKGNTYAVIMQIPHRELEDQYVAIYRQIRDSFRLIRL